MSLPFGVSEINFVIGGLVPGEFSIKYHCMYCDKFRGDAIGPRGTTLLKLIKLRLQAHFNKNAQTHPKPYELFNEVDEPEE